MFNVDLEAELLRSARAQGLLEPVFAYLRREIEKVEKPLEPTGAEWPYLRAFKDGEVSLGLRVLKGLENRSKPAPDEAENTED